MERSSGGAAVISTEEILFPAKRHSAEISVALQFFSLTKK
jgi:hypothetical protein